MALKPCQGCKKEVDTSARACPNCGRPNPTAAPLSLRRILKLVVGTAVGAVVLPFLLVGLSKSCESPAGKDQAARPAVSQPAPQPPVVWTGPAKWVETLQTVLKKNKAIKPFDSFRRDGLSSTVYQLTSYAPNSAATLERVDGKPAAWRWTVVAVKVVPEDLVPTRQLELLFKTSASTTWFQIAGGDFDAAYLSFSPASKPGGEAVLTLENQAFVQARNSDVIPWLCKNGRIPGAHGMSDGAMSGRCRELVRQMLKAPATAKFSWEEDDRPSFFSNCNMEWKSWVEAKNPFGVPLRNTFLCTFDARTGQLKAKFR
jgi:hypothetical protein